MVQLAGPVRKTIIIDAALAVAKRDGLVAVNFDSVARECRIPTSRHTVKHWFKRRDDLWRALCDTDASVREEGVKLGIVAAP